MIGLAIKSNAKRVLKDLERAQDDIGAASFAAWKRAGEAVVTEASTAIARKARVQKWMITGIGGAKKSRGGRIGRKLIRGPRGHRSSRKGLSGGVPQGISFYLRDEHLNPAGTAKKQGAVRVLKGGKNRGSVKAQGRYYRDAFVRPGKWGTPVIMIRDGAGGMDPARIEIGAEYHGVLRRIAIKTGVKTFERRLKHEIDRRMRRHGTR